MVVEGGGLASNGPLASWRGSRIQLTKQGGLQHRWFIFEHQTDADLKRMEKGEKNVVFFYTSKVNSVFCF